jgi:hypothetical protein
MKLIVSAAVTFMAFMGAAAFALPVLIPNGSSLNVCKYPPILPTDPSAPAYAQSVFKSTRPQSFEDDLGPDQSLGAASFSPLFGACIRITNSGGDLFTSTSGDLNGGLEGDCIEVYFCFDYCYYELQELPGGVKLWTPVAAVICTDPCEVCPAP